ncbi:MAG: hypothetical protein ACKO6H_05980, partial [Betaproteobacteria bacterium]
KRRVLQHLLAENWQSCKMLATVMTGIAKILAAANKFAHLIARLKVQVKQILESIAIVFDTDLHVKTLM